MAVRYPPAPIRRRAAGRARARGLGAGSKRLATRSSAAARRPVRAAALLLGGLPAGVVLGKVVGADLVVGLGRVTERRLVVGRQGAEGLARVVVVGVRVLPLLAHGVALPALGVAQRSQCATLRSAHAARPLHDPDPAGRPGRAAARARAPQPPGDPRAPAP